MNFPRPLRTPTMFLDRLTERKDDAKAQCTAAHSRRSSQSTSSENTYSPITPTFSFGGHTRMSSSTSSLSSSPPSSDHFDLSAAPKKPAAPGLPDVEEDPMEREFPADDAFNRESSESEGRWSYDMPNVRSSLAFPYYARNQNHEEFYSDSEIASDMRAKRRRSGESVFNTFTNRMSTRLPSFSRRHRKKILLSLSENNSPITSPILGRSRSTSRARSLFRRSGSDEMTITMSDAQQPSNLIDTIAEDEVLDLDAQPKLERDELEIEAIGPEALTRVSTPLLPHMIEETYNDDPGPHEDSAQGPGPASGSATYSGFASRASSPPASPQFVGVQSPPLSSRNSMNAVRPSQADTWVPTAEVSSPATNETRDEWTDKLGHADFQIFPVPYVPEVCRVESCNQLMLDWERARAEYSRHLGRTNTHFGDTSRIYHLTEEKWAWIDSTWKASFETAKTRARDSGDPMPPDSPREPHPVSKIPAMGDKFPQIGDEDIIGPMEQVASQIKRRPSKKAQFMNMIGNLRGRSLSGPRS